MIFAKQNILHQALGNISAPNFNEIMIFAKQNILHQRLAP